MDATFRSPHDEALDLNRERRFYVNVQGRNLEVQRIPGSIPHTPELVFLHEGLGSISHWKDFPRALPPPLDAPSPSTRATAPATPIRSPSPAPSPTCTTKLCAPRPIFLGN